MTSTVSELEKNMGIEVYATSNKGINGKIRCYPEDFIVQEILKDGTKATIRPKKEILYFNLERNLVCLLIKKNWDTFKAIERIAHSLGLNSERINIAGIKDKKAITSQHISIGGISHLKILNVKLKDIKLFPIKYSNKEISSNLLFGNQFSITVRGGNPEFLWMPTIWNY
jgi:tRNA pseudouridine13 synthase